MNTEILHPTSSADFERAAGLIQSGELVAFPTETVYGLGANGLDAAACTRIYEAKGRPSDNPLILHIADLTMAHEVTSNMPPLAAHLLTAFAPGPITVILPKAAHIPDIVTGGLSTVAGVPIAAPSANTSGRPSPTTAAMVYEDMAGRIPLIFDGGSCRLGVESTIVDCTEEGALTILRPGAVTREMIAAELPAIEVRIDAALTVADEAPRAPGMKYTHYAPRVPLTVYAGMGDAVTAALRAEFLRRTAAGERPAVIASNETLTALRAIIPAEHTYNCGARGNHSAFAACLYDALRCFDDTDITSLLAEGTGADGLGLAIMNRLRKASGERVIYV